MIILCSRTISRLKRVETVVRQERIESAKRQHELEELALLSETCAVGLVRISLEGRFLSGRVRLPGVEESVLTCYIY